MAFDERVYFGPEAIVALSSANQSLLSINLEEIATDSVGTGWQEIGYVRFPVSRQEPVTQFEVRKNFAIDHTKRGPDQNKTGALVAAFNSTRNRLRRFKNVQCMMRIAWWVEGLTLNEYEYLKGVRFTNVTQEVPDGEVVERLEFIWSTWGRTEIAT